MWWLEFFYFFLYFFLPFYGQMICFKMVGFVYPTSPYLQKKIDKKMCAKQIENRLIILVVRIGCDHMLHMATVSWSGPCFDGCLYVKIWVCSCPLHTCRSDQNSLLGFTFWSNVNVVIWEKICCLHVHINGNMDLEIWD